MALEHRAKGSRSDRAGCSSGLSKRIARDFKVASTGDAASLEEALKAVKQTGGAR